MIELSQHRLTLLVGRLVLENEALREQAERRAREDAQPTACTWQDANGAPDEIEVEA